MRSVLEFGSVVRNPSQSGQIEKLDKLSRLLTYKMGLKDMSTSNIANQIGLASLTTRRK